MNKTVKGRILIYIIGVFLMSLGIGISIYADLGVSPVSSVAYAVSLATGFTVGTLTIATNFFYVGIQVLITRKLDIKEAFIQLVIAFMFGFFIDSSLFLVRTFLPEPSNFLMQWLYLIISLFIIALGLTGYINMNFTLMPYDELTNVISRHYRISYGQARIVGDTSNVVLALVIGLVFLSSFGSVGIGTVVASLSVGRIINLLLKINEKYDFLII